MKGLGWRRQDQERDARSEEISSQLQNQKSGTLKLVDKSTSSSFYTFEEFCRFVTRIEKHGKHEPTCEQDLSVSEKDGECQQATRHSHCKHAKTIVLTCGTCS